jgi:Zn-dependent protease with chaperone function
MPSRLFYPSEGVSRDLPWITLYSLTFGLHLLCAVMRALFLYVPVAGLFWVTGHGHDDLAQNVIIYAAAFGLLLWSFSAFVYPVGAGQVWRASSGGRAPAEHERKLVEDAIREIKAKDPSVRAPAIWFVLDDWQLNAAALGDAMMVHTGALGDPGLAAVIAHELGHLNSTDSYLSVALGRLTWPAACFARLVNRSEGGGCLTGLFLLAGQVCSGLIVVPLTRPLWSAWFRRREFVADEYAAKLGFADELADALARHALEDDRPRPFQFISDASHPYTTHRIDALHNYASRQASVVA